MIRFLILIALFCIYAMLMSATAPAGFYLIASSFDGGPGYVFDTAAMDFGVGVLSSLIAVFCFTRLNRLRKFWNRIAFAKD